MSDDAEADRAALKALLAASIPYLELRVVIEHLPRDEWPGFLARVQQALEALHPHRPFSESGVEVELVRSAGLEEER